jgi:hypothetical protein
MRGFLLFILVVAVSIQAIIIHDQTNDWNNQLSLMVQKLKDTVDKCTRSY